MHHQLAHVVAQNRMQLQNHQLIILLLVVVWMHLPQQNDQRVHYQVNFPYYFKLILDYLVFVLVLILFMLLFQRFS